MGTLGVEANPSEVQSTYNQSELLQVCVKPREVKEKILLKC